MHRAIIWTAGAGAVTIGAVVTYRHFAKRDETLIANQSNVSRHATTEVPSRNDPLNSTSIVSDELMSRLESSFKDVYLQLTTIIQGVAFGVLAATALPNIGSLDLVKWLALLTCLTAILIIWHEYMIGATAFAWIPTLLDTIVPFGLGFAQLAMIAFAMGPTQDFLLAVTIAWLSGVVAQGNFWFHSRRGLAINRTSYPLLRRYLRFGFLANAMGFVTLVILVGLSHVFHDDTLDAIYTGCAFATTVPMLFRSVWQWNLHLKRHAPPYGSESSAQFRSPV